MSGNIRALLGILLSLIITACATTPHTRPPALVQTETYSEEQFLNHQNLTLFARLWQPQGAAKGNIVILHGTALHSGVYEPVAKQLTAAGYRVYAYDMQGWGRSEGKGADGYIEHFDDYASDLYLVLQSLKKRYPDAPNYVMGESLGGAVALYAALRNEYLFDGVITSAVGYKPSIKFLGLRAPGFVNSMTMTMAQMGGTVLPTMPVAESDLGIRVTVEDDAVQEQLLADPYVSHGWLPGAYISTLQDATDYIKDNLTRFSRPILLLHGEQDMLVPLDSSREVFRSVASTQKSLRLYDSPHTILLEKASTQAVGDVITFLDQLSTPKVAAQ